MAIHLKENSGRRVVHYGFEKIVLAFPILDFAEFLDDISGIIWTHFLKEVALFVIFSFPIIVGCKSLTLFLQICRIREGYVIGCLFWLDFSLDKNLFYTANPVSFKTDRHEYRFEGTAAQSGT